jgi:hypothetical protein
MEVPRGAGCRPRADGGKQAFRRLPTGSEASSPRLNCTEPTMKVASENAAAVASRGLIPARVNSPRAYSIPAIELGPSRSVPCRSGTRPGCRRR